MQLVLDGSNLISEIFTLLFVAVMTILYSILEYVGSYDVCLSFVLSRLSIKETKAPCWGAEMDDRGYQEHGPSELHAYRAE